MTDQTSPEAGAVRPPTDIEVAQFLSDFRARSKEQQESSPVWQELTGFPQWMGAQYRDEAPTLDAPPDPRLPALERKAAVDAQQAANPPLDPHTPAPAPDPNVITTGAVANQPNPWAEYRMPPADGSGCFMPVNVDQAPPWPGNWRRVQGGWFRDAEA